MFSTVTGAGYSFSAFLYTREFFHDAKGILSDNGVFAFWADYRMGFKGMSEIISALKLEFKYVDVKLVRPDIYINPYNIPYIVISASQSPLKIEDISMDPISKHIMELENKDTLENIDGYNIDDILEARKYTLCIDEKAKPSSMKTLSFAYDYKTVIDKKILNFHGWENKELSSGLCTYKTDD